MDLYKEVTDRIIAEMEKGIIPWEKPWIASGNCVAHTTGKPYSLLNQMLLGRPGEYLTFNQCQKEGGKVKKGEKAHMVVFWKWIEEKDPETEEVKQIPFLRYFNVFHIDQCEGLKAKYTQELPETSANADETAEAIIADYIQRSGVKLVHEQGDRAFYRPSTDSINLLTVTGYTDIVVTLGHLRPKGITDQIVDSRLGLLLVRPMIVLSDLGLDLSQQIYGNFFDRLNILLHLPFPYNEKSQTHHPNFFGMMSPTLI